MQQQQERPKSTQPSVRLNGIESFFATLSLVFGSAGFLYFWQHFRGGWSDQRTDYRIAQVTLLLGLLLCILAGLFLLARLRKGAQRLLRVAALVTLTLLIWSTYDAWRDGYYRYPFGYLPLLGFAAALFWLSWLAWYVKQRDGLKDT